MTPEEKAELDKLPRWGLEEKPMEEITVSEIEHLCEVASQRERKIEILESELEEERQARDAVLQRVKSYLDYFGKRSYESGNGTIEIRTRTSFKTPKTEEQKVQFFDWLKERGIFWSLVSVNSNSLNSLCKQEMEAAQADGRSCAIPGIEPPSEFQTVHIRRKR